MIRVVIIVAILWWFLNRFYKNTKQGMITWYGKHLMHHKKFPFRLDSFTDYKNENNEEEYCNCETCEYNCPFCKREKEFIEGWKLKKEWQEKHKSN